MSNYMKWNMNFNPPLSAENVRTLIHMATLLAILIYGVQIKAYAAADPTMCNISEPTKIQGDIEVTSGRDSQSIGTPLSDWFISESTFDCRPGTIFSGAEITVPASHFYVQDVVVDGSTYGLFQRAGSPVYFIMDFNIDGSRYPYRSRSLMTIPPASASISGTYHSYVRMRIVTGPEQLSGSFRITANPMLTNIILEDPQSGNYFPYMYFVTYPGDFNTIFKLSTCRTPNATQTVALGKIQRSAFNGVGSFVLTGKAAVLQFECDVTTNGLTIEATLTDANNIHNQSNRLSLSKGPKMATGIEIQLISPASRVPISYGLESSDPENPNQFWLENAKPDGGTKITGLAVRLIQTEATIRPGKINAQAIITFSYQ